MRTGLLIVLVVGVIALVVKRFRGEPMSARDTFGTPLILVAIGVFSAAKAPELNGTDIAWLVLGGVVGIAFGALRGTTIGLFARDGHLWQRYTVRTLAVWVVSMAAGFAVHALAVAQGMHPDARPTTLSIGIGMLGEMLTLGLRALSTGIPFAPERDARRSPLDGLLGTSRQSVADRLRAADRARTDHDVRHHISDDRPSAGCDRADRPRMTSPGPYPADAAGPDLPNGPRALDRSPTLSDGVDWLRRLRDSRR